MKDGCACKFVGRIGRVAFSKSGRTIYYKGKPLDRQEGGGVFGSYTDVSTGNEYWISGYKKRCGDRLFSGMIEIDADAREECWTRIRQLPENARQFRIN